MANMTFKANLLPQSKLGYELGSSTQLWHSYSINNSLITGTGTAGKDAGSGDNRYQPARWTFDTSKNATDGDSYLIKIPVAGHDYGVFMSVDNGAHYYPVVLNGTARITTHYPVSTYLQVVFESTGSAAYMFPLAGGTSRVTVSNGAFRVINYYDSNSDNGYYHRKIYTNLKAGSNKIFPYTLIMQNKDGRWESIVTSSTTDTTKAKNTHGFLLSQVWCMNANATYNSDADVGTYNIWTAHSGLIDMRYSINVTTSSGMTRYKPVYLVGTIGTDGLFYLADSWWSQTLPTTDDGKIYIYIGDAYDAYRLTLSEVNTAYFFRDRLQQYSDGRGIKSVSRSGTTFTVTRDDGTTFTFTQQDNNSVTGVKGNAESSYRTGQVNITPANIGALPLSGGTLTGNLVIAHAASATMTADSTNPKITFSESGTQPVHLIYTDYDNYRSPAGLKVVGGASATPAWFEVEGNIYAAAFKGNADTSTTASNAVYAASAGSVAWDNVTGKPINFKAYAGALNTGGWKTLNGNVTGANLSIAYNNNAATWNSGTYSASLVFGCSDTKGLLDLSYNTPIVTFGGSSNGGSTDDNPKWYFKLSGTSGQTYTFPSTSKTLVATDGTGASGTWDISITGNAATATKLGTTTVGGSTQPIYLNAGVPTAATSYANATVGTADKLTGFSSRAADFSWGNQTGTAVTVMNDSTGGSLGFRRDNPAGGQVSMVIDGTVYIKEGQKNIGDAIVSITRSGTTFTYTTLWGNTGTFTQQDNNSDTKNTAGSTDTSSKIFLIGATSQAANPQTYSDNQVYTTNGQLDANKMRVAEHVTLQYNTTTSALDFIFA